MRRVGFFKSIQFKFVLIYTLLILLAMQLIGVYFSDRLENTFLDSTKVQLHDEGLQLAYNIGEVMKNTDKSDRKTLMDLVQKQLDEGGKSGEKIMVVDPNGIILATTDGSQSNAVGRKTGNKIILKALISPADLSPQQYYVKELKQRVMVKLQPVKTDNKMSGLIFIQKPLNEIYRNLRDTNKILASATITALFVTALLGFFLARTITKPLAQMRRQALSVSQGDFTKRVDHYEDDEIGQLATSFNNMTERLEDANATTEAERRKLRSVLAYMTDGVIMTDRNGHVILMNNRSEELLRVYRQNVLGESVIKLLRIEEEYTLGDLYNIEESLVLDFSTEHQKLLIRVNFSIVKKESGANNGLIAVLHDVTEQEQIEADRREFVANVSHELRTPLTTMKSYLEALADGALEDDELAQKFLGVTQNETERMIRLVNDLLQLSKLDAADYKFNMVKTNFVVFFEDIIDRFDLSKRQNIQFVRKLPKRPAYVYIDPDKMTQVIDNIISNAMKYSPEGGKITFRVVSKGPHIVVSIKDQGVGIPKENLSKIFDRFYRVDRARSRKLGGTGLGLAIAKEIVAAHNGDIWAESEWSKGTTILFTLPLARGDQA